MAGHLIATYHGREQLCAWTLEGRRLADRLRPGTVTVIAEGHDGYWSLAGPVEVSHVYLTGERLRNCAGLVTGKDHIEIVDRVGFEDPVSARALCILSDDDVLGDTSARLLIERAADLLCLQLLRRHNAARSIRVSTSARGALSPWRLARAINYMLEHLDRPIGLEELAMQAGLSRYHFCTAFRIATGRTPHVWLTQQRVARAQQLMRNPALSISEIGLTVGYATPSAFAASFRRFVGVSPSSFRRRL